MVTAHLMLNVDYAGRGDHVTTLLDFVRRCKRIRKWQAGDLRAALDFLIACEHESPRRREMLLQSRDVGKASELLADLASKARRKFPDNVFFQFMVGELEMRKGPWDCNRRLARECFQRVLESSPGADDLDGDQIAKRARKNLDLLGEAGELPSHPSLPFPPSVDDDDACDEFGGLPFVFDEGKDNNGLPGFPFSGLPKAMLGDILRMCRQAGIDPEELFREAAAGKPFRFRSDERPSKPKK